MSSPINLKDHDFDGFAAALAPTAPNRVEHLKLFAAVFSHGARELDELKKAPAGARRGARLGAGATACCRSSP